jgi:hypothetical protein
LIETRQNKKNATAFAMALLTHAEKLLKVARQTEHFLQLLRLVFLLIREWLKVYYQQNPKQWDITSLYWCGRAERSKLILYCKTSTLATEKGGLSFTQSMKNCPVVGFDTLFDSTEGKSADGVQILKLTPSIFALYLELISCPLTANDQRFHRFRGTSPTTVSTEKHQM